MREVEMLACAVLKAGDPASEEPAAAPVDWAIEPLAYYKAPGWVLFRASVPLTSTQKVQKTQLFAAGTDPRRQPGVFDLRARKKQRRRS